MPTYSVLSVTNNINMNVNSQDGYCYYVINATNNNITIDLSSSYWEGVYWEFQRIDNSSNTVTINAPSGKTINGNSSISLTGYQYGQIIYTNDNFICPKINTTF